MFKRSEITDIYDSPDRSFNNTNYIVEVNDDKYLLRIPGKGTKLFKDRQAKNAYKQLNHKNLVEESDFRMYRSYCDQYLDWAILMQKASLEYAHLIKDVY